MILNLLKSRRFGPFFATQFLGAFNDNVFKNALGILIAFRLAGELALSSNTLVNLSFLVFIAPAFLFSATAGQIADRVEKSGLIRRIKIAEILVMLLGAAGLVLGNVYLLFLVLFLMGTQTAFFGPVKYGILPQHLKEEELVGGNGLIEMGTFLAILLGTLLGGILIAYDHGQWFVAVVVVVVAVGGWASSRGVPIADASDPELQIRWNIFAETWRILMFTRSNRTVFNSVLGISWFWFYGATFLAQFPNFAKLHLGGNEQVVTILLTVFSLGIGLGSLLCERMSGRLVEIGLVPFGAFGLTVFSFDLYLAVPEIHASTSVGPGAFLADPGNWRVLADLFLMALFGGFFIVPLYALVQLRSPKDKRSRIIAGNNVLNAAFMVLAGIVAIGLLGAGLSIPQLFLVVSLMTAAVSIYIFTLVPEFLMRFIVWALIHTVYKLDIRNVDEIPDQGPAVLVCNHVSFVDALIIAAACRRPVRFVMDHKIFKIPIASFVFKVGKAIPIAPKHEDPLAMERAFKQVARVLEEGEVVCIFPEGKITQDGAMNAFRPGLNRIVERSQVPVVPMALSGLWGSFFSRADGAAMSKPWRLVAQFRSQIELSVGSIVNPDTYELGRVEADVLTLRGDRT
ncbi:MAG: glycerol acyltransferase [Gammaproteobacteria bacterium]|nr:glycerol acyltransferase [Gammaproteobacteria bacterium]